MTVTAGSPATIWQVNTSDVPAPRDPSVLNVTVRVHEDGRVSLTPNDAVAGIILDEHLHCPEVSLTCRARGPGVPWYFESLNLKPRRGHPTLTRDGSKHSEMSVHPADYDAIRALIDKRTNARISAEHPNKKPRRRK